MLRIKHGVVRQVENKIPSSSMVQKQDILRATVQHCSKNIPSQKNKLNIRIVIKQFEGGKKNYTKIQFTIQNVY